MSWPKEPYFNVGIGPALERMKTEKTELLSSRLEIVKFTQHHGITFCLRHIKGVSLGHSSVV